MDKNSKKAQLKNEGSFDQIQDQEQQQQEGGGSAQSNGVILEQDRFLPIANISRIMKRVIPSEGKLSKEAKECVQECITEFLLFITSEASERCALEKRKTISGEDILTSFDALGFDEYLTPLAEFLRKYREANKLQTSQATSLIHGGPSALANFEQTQERQQQIDEENTDTSVQQEQAVDPSQPVIYLQEQQLVNPTNLQPVQVFYDAANGQYFIPVQQGEDGSAQPLWQLGTGTNSTEMNQQKHC